jgi:hypothetical protein
MTPAIFRFFLFTVFSNLRETQAPHLHLENKSASFLVAQIVPTPYGSYSITVPIALQSHSLARDSFIPQPILKLCLQEVVGLGI